MADPIALLKTAVADRYAIERELGRGGMATVYLAHDLKHGRPVALKVVHPELAATIGPSRFLQEIRVTSRLQHPHILPVFDSGESAGQLWYTMPFVEGESLREHLKRDKQLSVERALRITRDVIAALDYAHQHRVVHRDIKPENILLQGEVAVVADFGIAQAIDVAGAERLTETGLAVGTPAYMSPEQAAGQRVLDGRSDQYSLACVLYEMLAGEPPFTGLTPRAVLARHTFDPVPPLSTVRPGVPLPVERAIAKALDKVPADRYSTVAGFGEALSAPAVIPDTVPLRRSAPVPALTPLAATVTGAGRRRSRLLLAAAATAATGLMLLAINRSSGDGGSRAPGAAAIKTLAVQPFSNLTGDTAQIYLAQGLTDQLVTSLAQIGTLRVISLKDAKEATDQLVEQLGLDAVLAGSLQRSGNAVRVTVQLKSAATNQALWAQGYDGELSGILDLQAEVARSVASKVGAATTQQERSRLTAERPAVNPAAYEAYVRGWYFKVKLTKPDLRKAVGYFQQAIEADPAYAAAYAGLAATYNEIGYFGIEAPGEAFPKARAATLRALELDSMIAGAHGALAWTEFFYGWNFIAAEREFRRTLELDPKWAFGHQWYGLFLTAMSRADEALAEHMRARELDPLTLHNQVAFARAYYNARRYDEAIALSRKTLGFDSTFHRAHYWLGLSYQQVSRPADAVQELEKTVALSPISLYWAALGHTYAVAGGREKALRVLKELQGRPDSSYVSPFDIATVYAGLGDRTRTFEYLEKAYRERAPYLVYLAVDPHFDAFRADPRFRDLVHRIGLPAGS